MTENELIKFLRYQDVAHQADGDGGYALVNEIRRWLRQLDPSARELLWDILIKLISQRDKTLWGVALEVLIQENPPQIGVKLTRLLEKFDEDFEWKDQVVFALIRIRYFPSIELCTEHIQISLSNGRRVVLPLLAALCHLDSQACLEIASRYFGDALKYSNEASEIHRGYISAFVRNFLEFNEALIGDLIHRTRIIENTSANRLISMIDDYLSREFIQREVGLEKTQNLRKIIKSI